MPSTRSQTAPGVAAAAVLAYAVLIPTQLLLGVLAAGLTYLLGRTLSRLGAERFVVETGRPRLVAALGGAVLTVAYGLVVAGVVLGSLALAELLVLAAWVTGPAGPLVRAVGWVRAAREDVRVVRESVEAGGGSVASSGADDG